MFNIYEFILNELSYDLSLKYNINSSYAIPSVDAVSLSIDMQVKASDFKVIKAIRLIEYLYEQKPNIYEHYLKRSISLSVKITLRKRNALKFLFNSIEKFSILENFNYLKIAKFSSSGVYTLSIRDLSALYFLGGLPYDYFNWKNMIRINNIINWKKLKDDRDANFILRAKAYWSVFGVLLKVLRK